MSKLGELLRKTRELKGESLRDVEKATDVSNAYLSQIESGKIDEPSPNKLKALADHYEVNYAVLMEAAGYLQSEKKAQPSNVLFLTAQKFTDDEAAAIASFISMLKKNKENMESSNKRKK